MRIIAPSVIALALASAWFSAAHAKSFCPVPPQTCGGAHKLTRLPDGAIAISNICDLQAIPANSTDSYELTQDIDAICTAKWNGGAGFTPIGGTFVGTLDGMSHWIHGLTINASSDSQQGMLAAIGAEGVIENLDATEPTMGNSADSVAALGVITGTNNGHIAAAQVFGSTISSRPSNIGGISGYNYGNVLGGFFSGQIATLDNGAGIAGVNFQGGSIENSFSAGDLIGGYAGQGGVTGNNGGQVSDSGSSMRIVGRGDGEYFGGLVGLLQGNISNSYATGSVSGSIYGMGNLAGAAGFAPPFQPGSASGTYGIGMIQASGYSGGGIGWYMSGGTFSNNYWDKQTTGQSQASGGNPVNGFTGLSTASFKSQLPGGLDSNIWSQVPGVSYPFDIAYSCPWNGTSASNCDLLPFYSKTRFPLRDPNCTQKDDFFCLVVPPMMSFFEPPLAQFTAPKKQFGKNAGVYTILPVGQLQLFDYTNYKNAETTVYDDQGGSHPAAKLGCFGTVYTMLARLIGEIYPKAKVVADVGTPNICHKKELAAQAHIDCLLEDSDDLYVKGLAIWPASLQKYATIGSYVALDDGALKNIVESGQLAIIYGTAGQLAHVMLVTSEVKDSAGNVIRFVANDPELGMQVFIDANPADGIAYHRAVMHPLGTGKPDEYRNLSGFDFNATKYAAITWH